MESTRNGDDVARAATAKAAADGPVLKLPGGLLSALAAVPDPRGVSGRYYPLSALLSLALAAFLANQNSVLAMAEWVAVRSGTVQAALGFPDGRTPHQSTLQRLFCRLEPGALSQALQAWLATVPVVGPSEPTEAAGVALDGKAQRGRLAGEDRPLSAVQMLSAFCHAHGGVLGQVPLEIAADKPEAELSVAPTLIAQLDWTERVLTGDALFCQRHLCTQVVAAGGDYFCFVKQNQPTLLADVVTLFDPQPPTMAAPLSDHRTARSLDEGHGRQADTRVLEASTDLSGYTDWPHLAQVVRLARTWQDRHGHHHAVRYAVTSLPPARASAERLLALARGHWSIENRLHYVADVTLGEDHSRVRRGSGPAVLAICRAGVISLLRRTGVTAIASRRRFLGGKPLAVLALLGVPSPLHA